MCKHILNAQVSIRSPCCRKWFDCSECHQETEDHALLQRFEMIFACKKCKKCFRKDAREFEDSDEYCPHCDNHFVIDAVTPKQAITIESEDVRVDNRMIKDDRIKAQDMRTIFDPDLDADRLG
ncbi:zinc finger protein [Sporothrix schenckii 1099-18]|uniref:Zinc finger protein n=1 Tax=Sporothrix schenckii 1099-18 TaxID=1397361 RepID=A0A0F2M0T2_SPOSC|nr:zinc finger protein [Sporothrix schenckii 1099-18]KJR82365.1 zinc finger protein [Sporothrix schenckii 1099-18]